MFQLRIYRDLVWALLAVVATTVLYSEVPMYKWIGWQHLVGGALLLPQCIVLGIGRIKKGRRGQLDVMRASVVSTLMPVLCLLLPTEPKTQLLITWLMVFCATLLGVLVNVELTVNLLLGCVLTLIPASFIFLMEKSWCQYVPKEIGKQSHGNE